jgi:outer membrane lipoprotein-sorting protein
VIATLPPSLPPSLVRFEFQLEEAIRIERRRRPRRVAVRVTAVAAAAALGVAVANGLPGSNESPASAITRAEEVLTPSDDVILHVVTATTQTAPDGSIEELRTESWQRTTPPYDQRLVTDGRGRELSTVGGSPEVYNPLTNTIVTLAPGEEVPDRGAPQYVDERVSDRMLDLLNSGEAHEDGRTTFDGRDAIRIASNDGRATLLVDAATFEPLEWSTVSDDGVRETTHFERYETLPVTDENLALLSVRAQHPDASIDPSGTVDPDPPGKDEPAPEPGK